jgi:hypothetical protein
MSSRDLLDLFGTRPDRWPRARILTNVMMFYRPMLDGSCRGNASPLCGPNTLDNFTDRDAFRWLGDQGVKIATTSSVIVGAEGARDCDGASNLAGALAAVRNVRRNNASIDYIDMDEPWNKAIHEGTTPCFQEAEISSAAEVVHRFMQSIRSSFPKDNIRIGLTEPYPASPFGGLSVQQIESWLTALESVDASPAFLHLVKLTKQAIETPDHSLFMSFAGNKTTPTNLPEWSNCTHTKLIRDGWSELTGKHH